MCEKMKILVGYVTKTGTTKKCANLLADRLEQFADITICNLATYDPGTFDYDIVIVGAPVRNGAIHRKAKKYIAKNRLTFKNKPCAFFICNAFVEDQQKLLEKNITKDLRANAIALASFGGELHEEGLKATEKVAMNIIAKTLEKTGASRDIQIIEKNIDAFAKKIKIAARKLNKQ